MAWVAAVVEAGDDLHLAREDAEDQSVGKAAKPSPANIPPHGGKLMRIVAQALQEALELIEEVGSQPLAYAPVPR